MKNTFGNAISITLFGESHGTHIGAVIDGIAPGIKIDKEYINSCLDLRKPHGNISTTRREADEFQIISGEFNGYTTGTPLTVIIENTSKKSCDYESLKSTPRPGHADYTAECKYHGFQDYRGGGHFSGRITAALVAVGAILKKALEDKGIFIGTHISYLGGIKDDAITTVNDVVELSKKLFPALSSEKERLMRGKIDEARKEGDSIGGVLESYVYGVPAGVGEPFFDSTESVLSHLLFSIPGVKGVEFGAGFGFADLCGSQANDSFAVVEGDIVTETNNNGGINGGITNGMPIVFRCAVKPTPSIYKEQKTVDLKTGKNTSLAIEGRHDPAIIHRARAVVDAVTAIAIADMLTVRYGTDYLK